ncbi:hypothetical protein [Hymenobacter algoricola]|uniref:Uncharacterized protein n=1 Tax=Hymenobacter algoricola TaxID=486267 RepID=A0ABP7MEU0_9BACT
MKKTKNNKAKAGKKGLLGRAAKSLRKLGKGGTLSRLSTTQKVVGGTALVALGLSYLAKRTQSISAAVPATDAASAQEHLTAMEASS